VLQNADPSRRAVSKRPVAIDISEAVMRTRHFGLLAASCALLTGAARADDGQATGRPITIIASPTTLKVGSRCRVELNAVTTGRNETVTAYEGVITRASVEGVGLNVSEEKTTIVRKTPLAHAPRMDRFFRNVGIGRPAPDAPKEVWLPGAKIHSVRLIEGPPPKRPPSSTQEIAAPRFAGRPSRLAP